MGYSFYGGRQGESFKIVRNFMSVDEMNSRFQEGAAYRDVNYGEYVLINSDDVTNPQNGQVYKRGVNGPEYVGNFAGNPGYSPHVTATEEFQDYRENGENTFNLIQNTAVLTVDNSSIVDGGKYSKDEGWNNFINDIKVSTESTTNQEEGFIVVKDFVIQGSSSQEEVKYTIGEFLSKDLINGTKKQELLNNGFIKPINKAQINVSFQIPRTVFNFESKTVSPYKTSKIEEDNITENHLFAYGYEITVPKGIKGDSIIEIGELKRPTPISVTHDSNTVSWTVEKEGQNIVFTFSKDDYKKIYNLKENSNFLYYKQENYDNGQQGFPSDSQKDTADKVITTYHYIGPSPAGVSIIPYNENSDSYEISLNGISFITRDDEEGDFLKRLNFPDDWEDE